MPAAGSLPGSSGHCPISLPGCRPSPTSPVSSPMPALPPRAANHSALQAPDSRRPRQLRAVARVPAAVMARRVPGHGEGCGMSGCARAELVLRPRDEHLPVALLAPQRSQGAAAWLPGRSPPRSSAAALAVPVSAVPWLLPGTSRSTRSQTQQEPDSLAGSGACCFLLPAPRRWQLYFFTGATGGPGPPAQLYLPQPSCRCPRDHPSQAVTRLGLAQQLPRALLELTDLGQRDHSLGLAE